MHRLPIWFQLEVLPADLRTLLYYFQQGDEKFILAPYYLLIYQQQQQHLKSILWVTGSQCKDVRTGVMCSVFLVLQNSVSSALKDLKLSNRFFWKTRQKSVTVVKSAGN